MSASPRTAPRDKRLDGTLALLREGYEFIPNRCRRLGTHVFETRLMGQPAVCMTGAEAARVFYEPERFTRAKALPPTALTLLQDKGSVALLDGEPHRHRKEMFLQLLGPERLDRLVELMAAELETAGSLWRRRDSVVVYGAAQEILCRTGCTWAGVPLEESEVPRRTRELAAMLEGAGSVGPRQWRGQLLRARNERWIRQIIEDARSHRRLLPEGTAAHAITWHRDTDGELLDVAAAVVELINVLRPTLAVAVYITFAALALHDHPNAADYARGRRRRARAVRPGGPPLLPPSSRWSADASRRRSSGTASTSPGAGGCCSTSVAPTATPGTGTTPTSSGPSASATGRATRSRSSPRAAATTAPATAAGASGSRSPSPRRRSSS